MNKGRRAEARRKERTAAIAMELCTLVMLGRLVLPSSNQLDRVKPLQSS